MTSEELASEFPNAIRRDLFTKNERTDSFLVLHESTNAPDDNKFTVQGDLCPLWGIRDYFEPVNDNPALFGNYVPEKAIWDELEKVNPELLSKVKFDSEGGMFFAYTVKQADAETLMDFIKSATSAGYQSP